MATERQVLLGQHTPSEITEAWVSTLNSHFLTEAHVATSMKAAHTQDVLLEKRFAMKLYEIHQIMCGIVSAPRWLGLTAYHNLSHWHELLNIFRRQEGQRDDRNDIICHTHYYAVKAHLEETFSLSFFGEHPDGLDSRYRSVINRLLEKYLPRTETKRPRTFEDENKADYPHFIYGWLVQRATNAFRLSLQEITLQFPNSTDAFIGQMLLAAEFPNRLDFFTQIAALDTQLTGEATAADNSDPEARSRSVSATHNSSRSSQLFLGEVTAKTLDEEDSSTNNSKHSRT